MNTSSKRKGCFYPYPARVYLFANKNQKHHKKVGQSIKSIHLFNSTFGDINYKLHS